ncbi:hypothetical protein LLH00_09715 [bacterium]|nr:hypothetical protein [bacterium]
MRTRVGRFWFEGPWDYSPGGLRYVLPEPGVYAVLCRGESGCRTLELGAVDDLHRSLERCPHAPAWAGRCQSGTLCVAVRYDSEHPDNAQVLLELKATLEKD